MKLFYTNIKNFWPYYFVTILSFVTILIWFKDGRIIHFADSAYPLDAKLTLQNFLYTWKNDLSGGLVDLTGVALLPLFAFISFLVSFGLNAVYAQAFFFFLILSFTGISVVLLFKQISHYTGLSENPFMILGPTIFYMANLYISMNGWRNLVFLYIFYAFLPFIILLYTKFLEEKHLKYIIYLSIFTSLVISPALTNIGYVFILIIILIIVSLIFLFLKKLTFTSLLKLIIIGTIIWLLLNLWYLLPQFASISDTVAKATHNDFSGSLSILNVISSHASILNILSIQGFFSLYDTLGGKWYEWTWLYTESFLGILSLIFPLILVYTLLNRLKGTKSNIYYLLGPILIIFGTFLSKGSHEPFGNFFIYLVQNYPVPFLAFRAAYEKLGILVTLGYLFVLYFFFYLINQKYKRAYLISIVVVVIIIVLGFPIWTGTIFSSGNGIRPSAMIEIPPDYYEVANLLKSDSTALTLSLPLQGNTWLSSNWNEGKNGYVGIDILRWLTHTPIISGSTGNADLDSFDNNIEFGFTGEKIEIENLIKRNIKYVLVRKDINYEWARTYGKEMMKISDLIQKLDRSDDFIKKYESKNLALYEVRNEYIKPVINSNTSLLFQMINPTKYKINMKLKDRRNVFFYRTYNSQWKLYLTPILITPWCKSFEYYENTQIPKCNDNNTFFEGEELSYLLKQPIFNDTHEVVNGYANGWSIDPEYIRVKYPKEFYKETQDGAIEIEFVLYYKPQSYFYIGLIISGLSFMGCIGYLLWDWRKKRTIKV